MNDKIKSVAVYGTFALGFGSLVALKFAPLPEIVLKLHPTKTEANLRSLARKIASKYRVDEDLFESLVEQESNFNADVRSKAGAIGLSQVMPEWISKMGLTHVSELWVPYNNLMSGARILKLNYGVRKSWREALRDYNCFDKKKCGAVADKYADSILAETAQKKLQ